MSWPTPATNPFPAAHSWGTPLPATSKVKKSEDDLTMTVNSVAKELLNWASFCYLAGVALGITAIVFLATANPLVFPIGLAAAAALVVGIVMHILAVCLAPKKT